jgi:hypothetical protein
MAKRTLAVALGGAMVVGAAPATQSTGTSSPTPTLAPVLTHATAPAPTPPVVDAIASPQIDASAPATVAVREPVVEPVTVMPSLPAEPPPTLLAMAPLAPEVLPPLITSSAPAQVGATPTLADPVVESNAELRGNRASAWTENGSQFLLLEQDVEVAVGTYGFRADKAVVRIDIEQQTGRRVRHLAMVLDGVRPLRGRGPTQIDAKRLLVTASTTGELELVTNLLRNEKPNDPLIADAAERTARHLATMSQKPQDLQAQAVDSGAARRPVRPAAPPPPAAAQAPKPADSTPAPADTTTADATPPAKPGKPAPARPQDVLLDRGAMQPSGEARAETRTPGERIFAPNGIIRFHADKIIFQTRGSEQSPEPVLNLMGNVRVMYQDIEAGRTLTLSAQNAVLFLNENSDKVPEQLNAQSVSGIYLEDNVQATDGNFTVRAPRVYYDLKQDKAVVLDAVMFAWDERRQVPIYVRAEQLRQESRTSWSAQGATLSTSDFAEPHFAIAARKVTLRQGVAQGGGSDYQYSATDTTLRAGGVPVFYWPGMAGTADAVPLRSLEVGFDSDTGPLVRTGWDVFALAGKPKPEGVDLIGRVDYLGDHGPGLGANLEYDLPELRGMFDGYLVAHDTGDDEIGGRKHEIEHDGDTRGYALWRHRQQLQQNWELSLEMGYVSDPTFLEEFFRDEAEESKPYEASVYLKKYEDDWAFTFLSSYNLNDFVPQTALWQARGSTVDKLPELGYYRIGTSLWEDRLTYFSETRASRLRRNFDEHSARDRGFSNRQALDVLGYAPASLSWDDFVAGTSADEYRLRFDTRHEVQAPFEAGIFDVVPYATGRVTAYDDDFEDISGEESNYRLWGALGSRLHTSFSRTYADVENRLLDLHRVRHIIEPNVDVFIMGSTVDQYDFLTYDETVEPLAEGFGIKGGVRQTLQTQRGGPGRWRNVDWLIVDQNFVYRSDDADVDQPLPRLFGFRPEYSIGGSHYHTEVLWMVSDTLAAAGEVIYSFESDSVETWRTGLTMQHSPVLSTFVDYADIDPLSSRLLSYGFTYQLTTKWTIALRHTLDFANAQSRGVEVSAQRRLPQWDFIIIVRHDEVDDEQTVGFVLVPRGIGGSRPLSATNDRLPW